MNPVSLIVWIVVGTAAGIMSRVLIKGRQVSLISDVLVGIVGSSFFGLLLSLLVGDSAFAGASFANILTSLMGAIIVLVLVKMMR